MIEQIKKWFFYREFKNSGVKNQHHAGTNPASSICILFDGTEEDDRKKVHRFKKMLNPDGKKSIKSLAFVNNDLPLDNIDYDAYNKKNVKWYGIPFGDKVTEFLLLKFDVLIVLCKKMLPHYEYIVAHSSAGLIIGPATEKADVYFDLIVDTGELPDLDAMINNILKVTETIAIK